MCASIIICVQIYCMNFKSGHKRQMSPHAFHIICSGKWLVTCEQELAHHAGTDTTLAKLTTLLPRSFPGTFTHQLQIIEMDWDIVHFDHVGLWKSPSHGRSLRPKWRQRWLLVPIAWASSGGISSPGRCFKMVEIYRKPPWLEENGEIIFRTASFKSSVGE